jgi:hypothetical protein
MCESSFIPENWSNGKYNEKEGSIYTFW